MRTIADINAIPSGIQVFIDANIFIYHFAGISQQCTDFLRRIQRQEIKGVISVLTVAELIHRRMIAEAIEKGLVTLKNAVKKMKENPEIVKRLTQYSEDIRIILSLPIEIENLTKDDVLLSAEIRRKYGLLTNDSLNLALMKRLGIRNIATRDIDFERVKEINVWKPTDIK